MSERIHSITIILENDIRQDGAESLLLACRSFRGVISVVPNVSNLESVIAQERARRELGGKLFDVIYPIGT